ncbi:MerR family transcriptional regulator [Cohnella cellulosilytica]|uniref:MerR family transcriptional regulator n=1 Tax=Cohnella cellulosilytica TaxID=986710 RepID=A0ABW2F4F0_9BACL
MGYTIKQVAEKTKLDAHVLRYYEKEGLLSPVSRKKGGIRHYSEDDLEWLGLIRCLKNTGMSIKQIKSFVDLSAQGKETLKERCDMLVEHKKNVEAQIREMGKHLEKVSHKISHFTAQHEEYVKEQDRHNVCDEASAAVPPAR